MKPRFDPNRPTGNRTRSHFRAYRPNAKDLMADSGLSRGEASLYFILMAAVLLAFVQHVQVVHNFVKTMPEFATAVANLVRPLV